ncbi:thiamine pyrophosphate-binding protein [Bradyrhizobium sp. 142]|uniref:thiamine pyrophosphate-binding protein n=1 Tax=Bradyrhizobium sp. 142 TaxID=2782618 RepID=UPI001FF96B6C|nr:thiamine pyrophosphate-binding protein [Bradyrhizobium sp. 142]
MSNLKLSKVDTAVAPARRMTGGRFIAETIKAKGISHVFFMDAVLRRALTEMEDLGIKRILGHSEKGIAYMADGYARALRRPAVCMAQSVGAANLAAALQESWFAYSPVVALTGRHAATYQYRNAYQELPHEPLYASVTKFRGRVDEVSQLPHLLRQAFREATTGASRPVHLDIAGYTGDIVGAAEFTAAIFPEETFAKVPAFRLSPDPESLSRAAAAIAASERPVILAGAGLMMSGAEGALKALVEHHGIPVVMSLDAKHALPEFHPQNGGVAGTYSRSCANQILHDADLVIYVGSDTGDMITNHWKLPKPETQIVQIDIDPAELGRNFPEAIAVHGDPKTALERLDSELPFRARANWQRKVTDYVAEWRAEAETARSSEAMPIRPERLCREISDWLPKNAMLVADTGYASHWSGTLVYLTDPAQGYLRAAGSLGWAFPASLGVQCAMPDRPVVCLTGDGGFMYHLPELETARRHGLNVITIVDNNHCLGQGRRNIDIAYEGRKGNKEEIFAYRDTDFAQIARDFDCFGVRVEKPGDLAKAFDHARRSGKPAVIDVVTDFEALAPLPWTPPSGG